MLDDGPITRPPTMAIVGGVLAALSVAAELVYPVQEADGSSAEPVLHGVYLVVWVVGWVLIAAMALGLHSRVADGGRSRGASIGRWLLLAGAAAFAVFGFGQVMGILLGIDAEALFVLFLLAFPLLVIGFLLVGVAMRRANGAAAILAFVAAAGFLLALLAEADPWHDIGLLTGALAVAGFGLGLRRA